MEVTENLWPPPQPVIGQTSSWACRGTSAAAAAADDDDNLAAELI